MSSAQESEECQRVKGHKSEIKINPQTEMIEMLQNDNIRFTPKPV